MQLVACGAQDIFLTGSPMISYFKTVYRRHTNFAIETVKQTFDTPAGFGVTTSSTLSRNGDLITGAYIQASLPDLTEKNVSNFKGPSVTNGLNNPAHRYTRWVDNIGHYLIKSVEISIGGSTIDRHYSDWLEIWAQLTIPAGKMPGYRKMIGQDPKNALGQNTGLQADVLSSMSALDTDTPYVAKNTYIVGRDIFIPLQFWFCRNIGLALPLIALQYHDVRILVSFREAEELIQLYAADNTTQTLGPVGWVSSGEYKNYVSHNSLSASLWVDYVFLDADERRRFAQVSHEYLIEQVQYQEDTCMSNSSKNINLTFNHPVKELLWVAKGFEGTREWSNFTNTQLPEAPPFQTFDIQNNQLIDGLTGLPSETYISPSKLRMTITTPINLTELIDTYFTVQSADYTMLNGDAITINSNGDTSTNVTLVVLNTVNGVANKFLTKDVLVNGLTYNKIISILRTTRISFPEKKVIINLRSSADKVPFIKIQSTTVNITTFMVNTINFIMTPGDVVNLTNTDKTQSATLVVSRVDTNGIAIEFFLRTPLVNNILYNTVTSVNRTGNYIETSQVIRILINTVNSYGPGTELILYDNNNNVNTEFTMPSGFSMNVGDTINMKSSSYTSINLTLTLTLTSVSTNGFPMIADYIINGAPTTVNTFTFDIITSIMRSGLNLDISQFRISIQALGNVYNRLDFYSMPTTILPGSDFVMNIGDIITVVDPINDPINSLSLTVSQVDGTGEASAYVLNNSTYQNNRYTTMISYVRDTQVLFKTDLVIYIRSTTNFPIFGNNIILSSQQYTSEFVVIPSTSYVMSVGDLITVTSRSRVVNRSLDILLKVTKVNNGIATEFLIVTASSLALFGFLASVHDNDLALTIVMNIVPYSDQQTNLEHPPLVIDSNGTLSDIKTYDDLMRFSNYDSVRPYNSITGLAANPFSRALLTMNGAERFAERPGTYFSLVQAQKHHTNIPVSPGINVYSFALKPEEHQPSGTCNFSRVEDAKLRVKTGQVYQYDIVKQNVSLQIKIFAINYNILRIVNGMGGLAYN